MDTIKGEKRRFVRIHLPCELTLKAGGKKKIHTQAESISTDGVRVMIREKLKTPSIINLTMYTIKRTPVVCKGKVVWARPMRTVPKSKMKNIYNTGIKFYKMGQKDKYTIRDLVVSVATGRFRKVKS